MHVLNFCISKEKCIILTFNHTCLPTHMGINSLTNTVLKINRTYALAFRLFQNNVWLNKQTYVIIFI